MRHVSNLKKQCSKVGEAFAVAAILAATFALGQPCVGGDQDDVFGGEDFAPLEDDDPQRLEFLGVLAGQLSESTAVSLGIVTAQEIAGLGFRELEALRTRFSLVPLEDSKKSKASELYELAREKFGVGLVTIRFQKKVGNRFLVVKSLMNENVATATGLNVGDVIRSVEGGSAAWPRLKRLLESSDSGEVGVTVASVPQLSRKIAGWEKFWREKELLYRTGQIGRWEPTDPHSRFITPERVAELDKIQRAEGVVNVDMEWGISYEVDIPFEPGPDRPAKFVGGLVKDGWRPAQVPVPGGRDMAHLPKAAAEEKRPGPRNCFWGDTTAEVRLRESEIDLEEVDLGSGVTQLYGNAEVLESEAFLRYKFFNDRLVHFQISWADFDVGENVVRNVLEKKYGRPTDSGVQIKDRLGFATWDHLPDHYIAYENSPTSTDVYYRAKSRDYDAMEARLQNDRQEKVERKVEGALGDF